MIANPRVTHRLSWWGCLLLIAALIMLPCLPTISRAQPPDTAGPRGAASASPEKNLQAEIVAVEQLDEIFLALTAFAKDAGEKNSRLEMESDFAYQATPLSEVIGDIMFRYKIPMIIDRSVPEAARMRTITCALEGVRLHVALSKMLLPILDSVLTWKLYSMNPS